ncbi:MAG: hypothetical protein ACK5LZ_04880 [Anaerorhabdus sp.]
MIKIKKAWPLVVLFFFINIISVFSINYFFGDLVFEERTPFELSENYVEFYRVENTDIDWLNLINVEEYKKVTIFSITQDPRVIGVFDLRLWYYNRSSKITGINQYRYFSEEDYKNRNNVAIGINFCDFARGMTQDEINNTKAVFKVDDVIHCLYVYNMPQETMIFKNLYAIQGKDISRVYVDSYDLNQLNQLEVILNNAGFKKMNKKYTAPLIIEGIISAMNGRPYQKHILQTFLATLLIYCVTVFISRAAYLSEFRIHQVLGATPLKIYLQTIMKIIVGTVLGSFLMALTIPYLDLVVKANYIDLITFLKIQSFFLILNTLVFSINFLILMTESKKRGGLA